MDPSSRVPSRLRLRNQIDVHAKYTHLKYWSKLAEKITHNTLLKSRIALVHLMHRTFHAQQIENYANAREKWEKARGDTMRYFKRELPHLRNDQVHQRIFWQGMNPPYQQRPPWKASCVNITLEEVCTRKDSGKWCSIFFALQLKGSLGYWNYLGFNGWKACAKSLKVT